MIINIKRVFKSTERNINRKEREKLVKLKRVSQHPGKMADDYSSLSRYE